MATSYQLDVPPRYESPYTKGTAKILNDVLSNRAQGKDVGFAPEDLATMRSSAVDEGNRQTNELVRRGLAARRLVGAEGMGTGGAQRLHERAIATGEESRSKAIKDIGIKNALLKRQEQQAGLSGLQGFTTAERGYESSTTQQNLAAQQANFNNALMMDQLGLQQGSDIWGTLGNVGSALLYSGLLI
jgi:hypothetical protein